MSQYVNKVFSEIAFQKRLAKLAAEKEYQKALAEQRKTDVRK